MNASLSSIDPANLHGIIWDLDNTLYRFNDAFEQACNAASGRAAMELGVPMDEAEAIKVAEASYYDHGYSGFVFERDYDICRETYHFAYHKAIDEKIVERNEQMVHLMDALALPHVIFTNASHDWAVRVLTHLDMIRFFPEDRIIAQERADFTPKARGAKGFEIALDLLDMKPDQVLMVDDMTKNLRIPKEMGMHTAFIHHGKKEDKMPAWVDEAFTDTITLLQRLIQPRSHQTLPAAG